LGACWACVAGATTPHWNNASSEQRIVAYQRRQVTVSLYQQDSALKEIRAATPEYASIHSHVLQDVLARLAKAYQAFFRRVKAGE
jgi:putative transposase